ncbi:MAG: hypothetical protein ACXWME_05980 [Syntrophales bacterium]
MGFEEDGKSKAFSVSNTGLIEDEIGRRNDYLKHDAKDTVDAPEYKLIYLELEQIPLSQETNREH